MLSQLLIQNIAVIRQAEFSPDRRFSALTGETGAGKSVLIGAINALRGERASRELIRSGENRALVTGVFCSLAQEPRAALAAMGFTLAEDEDLILTRELRQEGGYCRVNGQPVTVSMLRQIGELLLTIHGQNDNGALYTTENHRRFLDDYGELAPLLGEYGAAYRALRDCEAQIEALTLDEEEKARRIEQLEYKVSELTAAELSPGEEEQLTERRRVIRNAERIAEALSAACEALDGSEENIGAVEQVQEAAASAAEAARYLEPALAPADRLRAAAIEIEDVLAELRAALELTEFDPRELSDLEERLSVLYRIKRRYGGSVEAALEELAAAEEELRGVTLAGERLAALQASRAGLYQTASALAARLTKARTQSAAKLEKALVQELAELDMPKVRIAFALSARPLSPTGAEEVQMLISTNAGEELRPLTKIASGGEVSRIMLALKNQLASRGGSQTLIFDEVDSGVSGRAAQKIGRKLMQLSQSRQVLCVTHLAQVAAYADTQLLIAKSVLDERTYTELTPLDAAGRVEEIARIMGGETITELTRQSAAELLQAAADERAAAASTHQQ